MSGRTLQRAPSPHQAPLVAAATRRILSGTVSAMLLLSAAGAGPAKAEELDGERLALCKAFKQINHQYVAANYDPTLTQEHSDFLYDERRGLVLQIVALTARTLEGLVANARAVRAAMHADVPEYLSETFLDCRLSRPAGRLPLPGHAGEGRGMNPTFLSEQFVRAGHGVSITLQQPGDQETVTNHTGCLLGAMYARGKMHHVRVSLEGGVALIAPPSWIARESRCRVLQAKLQVLPEWSDGSMFVPLIRDMAKSWGVDIGSLPGEPHTVA